MEVDAREMFDIKPEHNVEMANALVSALVAASESGFDYLKFKRSVQSLQKMGLDHRTSIESAFTTVSTMGVKKDSLLQSIKRYKTVLDGERSKFAATMKKHITLKVDEKRIELTKLEKRMADNLQKIKELEEENIQITKILANGEGDIQAAEDKINQTRDAYKLVFEHIEQIITGDYVDVDQILQ